MRRSTSSASAATAPPPGLTIAPERSRRSRRRSRRTRTRCSPTTTCGRARGRRGRARRQARPRRSARSSAARAVRARQPGRDAARRRLRAHRARRPSATASTCASACASAAATRARRSRSASARSSTASAARPLRRRVPPGGEPLERHGRRRSSSSGASSTRASATRSCAHWLAANGGPARRRGRRRRARSSPSSSSRDGREAEPARVADVPRAARRRRLRSPRRPDDISNGASTTGPVPGAAWRRARHLGARARTAGRPSAASSTAVVRRQRLDARRGRDDRRRAHLSRLSGQRTSCTSSSAGSARSPSTATISTRRTGTAVFVGDPESKRTAIALEDGTTVVVVGCKARSAYKPGAFEVNIDVFQLFQADKIEQARRWSPTRSGASRIADVHLQPGVREALSVRPTRPSSTYVPPSSCARAHRSCARLTRISMRSRGHRSSSSLRSVELRAPLRPDDRGAARAGAAEPGVTAAVSSSRAASTRRPRTTAS